MATVVGASSTPETPGTPGTTGTPDTPGVYIPASLAHQLSLELWQQTMRPGCAPCIKELHNLILRGMDNTPSPLQSIESYPSLSTPIDEPDGECDEGDEATSNIQEEHVPVSHAFVQQLQSSALNLVTMCRNNFIHLQPIKDLLQENVSEEVYQLD